MLGVSIESERRFDRRSESSCCRADATVRWPPQDGQPEPTLAAILRRCDVLKAPAATLVLHESASSATSGRPVSMIGLCARPNVRLERLAEGQSARRQGWAYVVTGNGTDLLRRA